MEEPLKDKIQCLNDTELTILAALVAGQHCILSTSTSSSTHLVDALLSTCRTTFGLHPAVLQCTNQTTVDELSDTLLETRGSVANGTKESRDDTYPRESKTIRSDRSSLGSDDSLLAQDHIAHAVIIADLDLASESIQVQIIELLRTKRLFSHSAMYTAPRNFLLIATLSQPGHSLTYHLNDMIATSQICGPEDYPMSTDSATSFISNHEIEYLRLHADKVRLTAEVDAYLYNIVLYMRMSRYVQGGVSATATRQMRALCKALAALHGISFVTPSLVMLAARKIYPHRLVLASATTEQSLQWGSDPVIVQQLLESVTIDEVVDDVIDSVETPL